MYSQVHIYLDTDAIFIILALYATRIELKWNNQDEIEVPFMFLSSPVRSSFLRMYQTVDLTSPNVPALSLWWICFVFEA